MFRFCITVILISFDYVIPAIITGAIIVVQPVILIIVSTIIEKKCERTDIGNMVMKSYL